MREFQRQIELVKVIFQKSHILGGDGHVPIRKIGAFHYKAITP